jgi:iron complex outermembrane recepter protein
MKKIFMEIFKVALGIGLFFSYAPSVMCQQTGNEFTLEEITVTAQKRAENIQNVPTPVEVIQGYELTEMGKTTLEEALTGIAAATVQKKGRELNVTIRGMDDDAMPGDSFSMVAVVIDGAYSTANGVGMSGLFDMQRVEVLSGPQGTLYGRNAAGGVVNMISNNPTTEKFDAAGSIEFGNYHLMNASGMVNAPINDKWAIRSAFQSSAHNGYVSNDTNDNQTKSGRVKLRWAPADDINILFGFENTNQNGRGPGDGVDPWETGKEPENPWYSSDVKDLFHIDRKTTKMYMEANYNTSFGDLTFLPARVTAKGWDEVPGAYRVSGIERTAQGHNVDDSSELSGELRMASKADSSMKWVGGLYYYKRAYKTRSFLTDAVGNDPQYGGFGDYSGKAGNWRRQTNTTGAVFGNFTLPLGEVFRVNVGGRYTTDDEKLETFLTRLSRPTDVRGLTIENYDNKHFDYKLGFEYDVWEDMMLWGEISTGYKHIKGNAKSQALKSYQLGTKARYLNSKLQLNMTAWYYDYTNFNVNKTRYYYDTTGERQTDQGTGLGDATLYGLDIVSNLLVTKNDRLDLSASYLQSKVSNMIITWRYYYPPDAYLEGQVLNNSPEWTITANYQHTFDLNSGAIIIPKISLRYETEKTLAFQPNESEYPGFDLKKLNLEPTHHMTDFSLMYSNPSSQWNINAYVKNIENHPEKSGLMRMDMRLGEPRTYGIVLSINM